MEPGARQFGKLGGGRGFTLLELLIVVAIVSVLVGITLIGGKIVRDSQKGSRAQQQLAMVTRAIDEYASFWPKWKVGGVVVAEKGWPDFIPGRLFETNAFEVQSAHGFNDDLDFHVADLNIPITDLSTHGGNDALNANLCLAYCLTESSGKGPYIAPNDAFLLKDIQDDDLVTQFLEYGVTVTAPLYPKKKGSKAARRGQVLVDPWGTPYRYFWVYRAQSAYKGYMPVETADTSHPDDLPPVAVGYVLESAGPNRKFGNVWKANPTADEYRQATDNPTIMP